MSNFGNNFWDNKYSTQQFIYGHKPNEFFKIQLQKLKPGKIFLPGDGEGRNSVFAAKLGWDVDAVDFSKRAKEKALQLAIVNNVKINYDVDNLTKYNYKRNYYDAAGIIFLHLNPQIRKDVHRKIINSLKSGGKIIMEVFHKDQLGNDTGGPQNIDMLYSLNDIKESFYDLETELLEKEIKQLDEGSHHSGEAAVIKYVGIKK